MKLNYIAVIAFKIYIWHSSFSAVLIFYHILWKKKRVFVKFLKNLTKYTQFFSKKSERTGFKPFFLKIPCREPFQSVKIIFACSRSGKQRIKYYKQRKAYSNIQKCGAVEVFLKFCARIFRNCFIKQTYCQDYKRNRRKIVV